MKSLALATRALAIYIAILSQQAKADGDNPVPYERIFAPGHCAQEHIIQTKDECLIAAAALGYVAAVKAFDPSNTREYRRLNGDRMGSPTGVPKGCSIGNNVLQWYEGTLRRPNVGFHSICIKAEDDAVPAATVVTEEEQLPSPGCTVWKHLDKGMVDNGDRGTVLSVDEQTKKLRVAFNGIELECYPSDISTESPHRHNYVVKHKSDFAKVSGAESASSKDAASSSGSSSQSSDTNLKGSGMGVSAEFGHKQASSASASANSLQEHASDGQFSTEGASEILFECVNCKRQLRTTPGKAEEMNRSDGLRNNYKDVPCMSPKERAEVALAEERARLLLEEKTAEMMHAQVLRMRARELEFNKQLRIQKRLEDAEEAALTRKTIFGTWTSC